MSSQESQAKVKVILDTDEAEAILRRMDESLGGARGPGQASSASGDARAPSRTTAPGRGGGGGTTVLGGGVTGKLSQIIKLLAIVAAASKLLEPVIALAKVYLEGALNRVHEATGLDELSAQAETAAALRVLAEKIGAETHAKSSDEILKVLELYRPIISAEERGRIAGGQAATDQLLR